MDNTNDNKKSSVSQNAQILAYMQGESEIWRDVHQYEGLYQVSNHGRIINKKTLKVLKTRSSNGYILVGLTKNGKQKKLCVHKIVAMSFVENPNNFRYVRHKDGNKHNNYYLNLEWYDRIVSGVGVLDIKGVFLHGKVVEQSYKTWACMIDRCYSKTNFSSKTYYSDCFVCDEWLYYSNFKKWFDDGENGYIDGYELDKDIIKDGNRIYCPEFCCFVPQEINKSVVAKRNKKNKYKRGVGYDKKRNKYLGIMPNSKFKRFDTEEEAYQFYKTTKEKHIKELAIKYYSRGYITKKVYESLMAYTVK